MKYTYIYKSSDGVRHEAVMEAPSREEVFATLRERGIRAIKVVAADGSKANGEVRGGRASWFVLRGSWALLGVLALTLVGIGIAYRAGEVRGTNHDARITTHDARTAPRHQIYGDPVIVEAFERGHFDPYLTNRLDQMLAWFAQPGKLMCPKGTDMRRAAELFVHEFSVLIKSENAPSTMYEARSTISPADPREIRELKQIVNGLREEMAAYLANGNGTPRSYWRRLIQRTTQEAQIYERTRRELEHEKSETVWEQKNDALRLLGLRTIPKANDGE